MRPVLPPGGRSRKLLARIGRPLPRSVRGAIGDAVARFDYRREEQRIARDLDDQPEQGDGGGIPVPPPLLRVRVTGAHAERRVWLKQGATDARLIREMVERHDAPLEGMGAFLDFGCGCGRVARHWAGLSGPAIHGTDVSRPAVRWCRRNLPFMTTVRCGPEPPLPYDDGAFDFAYALSVLTHLTEDAGQGWLRELVRVVRPGGLLLFTAHGERFIRELDPTDRERFHRGEFVVAERPEALAGSNAFAAFHPPAYVTGRLLPSVEVDLVETVYEDPVGGGLTPMPVQDNYLVRRRG
jgi:SAM-dependent methyltransferase